MTKPNSSTPNQVYTGFGILAGCDQNDPNSTATCQSATYIAATNAVANANVPASELVLVASGCACQDLNMLGSPGVVSPEIRKLLGETDD
jgi:hypothetical protein